MRMVDSRMWLCVWVAAVTAAAGTGSVRAAGRNAFDPFGGEASSAPATSQPAVEEPVLESATVSATSVRNLGPIIGRVQFRDDDLSLVFQVVSDATGWSIFPAAKVGGKITLYARDIAAGDLLDAAVRMAGFVYVKQGKVVNVMTYEDYMLYYGVVKRVFTLEYRDAGQVTAILSPFVTPRGKLIPDPATRTLVIYEVPTNLGLLEEVVRKIDLPADSKIVKVVKLMYADAVRLADHLQSVFADERQQTNADASIARVAPATSQPVLAIPDVLLSAERNVVVYPVARTNHLVLRGYSADLARIEELIAQLDMPEDLETRNYQVIHLSAEDVLASLEQSLGVYSSMGGRSDGRSRGSRRTAGRTSRLEGGQAGGELDEERIRLSFLEESNAIVVTAPAVAHRQVAEFLRMCDTPPMQIAGGIRHYRLQNAAAADVARILLELVNQSEQQADRSEFRLGAPGSVGPQITGPSAAAPRAPAPAAAPAAAGAATPLAGGASAAGDGGLIGVAAERRTEKPRITFSEATNTVIIQATVQEHVQFAQVIKELDRQMPQVLIEVVIVELRGTDDVDVGVELENFGLPGDCIGRLLFTSYGLSAVNPATGQRTLNVMPGGTAAITRSQDVPAIIHALQGTGKAKIRSAPRLLVNDNTEGVIQSIAEEPYSQVNASTTVATTSFGGFVQAGTQLRITPHISNEDYLRMEYEITLNSFRGASANPNLPPARDTSTIMSQATVPDGGTLIVAGLSYRNQRDTINGLPLIANVPLLNLVFGRTVTEEEATRIYVFMRPMILRDDQFRQLRQVSDQDYREAGEPSPYPENPTVDLQEG